MLDKNWAGKMNLEGRVHGVDHSEIVNMGKGICNLFGMEGGLLEIFHQDGENIKVYFNI